MGLWVSSSERIAEKGRRVYEEAKRYLRSFEVQQYKHFVGEVLHMLNSNSEFLN